MANNSSSRTGRALPAISRLKRSFVRAPDGCTLVSVNLVNSINATLYEQLNFNLITDIAPVAAIARASIVLLVNPSVPAKTVSEFIGYAKVNPGRINMASGGAGKSA